VIAVLIDPAAQASDLTLDLDAAEIHHLRVRRARTGDEVRVLDGAGRRMEGVLELGSKRARVRLRSEQRVGRPIPLVLAVGAGDRERFGWLVEKAAELGVTEIVPLVTQHAAEATKKLGGAQLGRLRRRAREAIKQSMQPWAPTVAEPETVAALCSRPSGDTRWLTDPAGAPAPESLPAAPVLIAVGPEGGFTEEERRTMTQAGFQPIGLGPGVLRFETAAIAAATLALTARHRGRHG
jgi:16S rRNA (uracil1498-N3)-methyltransferase